MAARDEFADRAFELLTSGSAQEAFQIDREDGAVRDRYGRGSSDPAFGEDAGPHWMDQFLMARRLVEAGVRFVTLEEMAADFRRRHPKPA